MERMPQISKAAFLARINFRAGRFAVDSFYKRSDNGKADLVIEYDDGSKKVFRGFDRAA